MGKGRGMKEGGREDRQYEKIISCPASSIYIFVRTDKKLHIK